jgi:hypothetical protein
VLVALGISDPFAPTFRFHPQNLVTTIRTKGDDDFQTGLILGGLVISCMFAGYRIFQVASLVDDVKKYAALQDGQSTSRSRSASLALVDTLQLRDSHGQNSSE